VLRHDDVVRSGGFRGFNAVTDVVVSDFLTVETNLIQCGGDGRCSRVATSGSHTVIGHAFVATPIFAGQHGHSYQGEGNISTFFSVRSPFIPYP
jgi:hypothetical protein